VRKAEDDYRLGLAIVKGGDRFHDQLCFHCQQSAEKYLKALLEEVGQAAPKTHDLDRLLKLLQPSHPVLRSMRRGLLFLSGFGVDTRYPGSNASKRQAAAAWRWAGKVREVCRELLGIRRPRTRR
jgi:HEPN domain-containing protein